MIVSRVIIIIRLAIEQENMEYCEEEKLEGNIILKFGQNSCTRFDIRN